MLVRGEPTTRQAGDDEWVGPPRLLFPWDCDDVTEEDIIMGLQAAGISTPRNLESFRHMVLDLKRRIMQQTSYVDRETVGNETLYFMPACAFVNDDEILLHIILQGPEA